MQQSVRQFHLCSSVFVSLALIGAALCSSVCLSPVQQFVPVGQLQVRRAGQPAHEPAVEQLARGQRVAEQVEVLGLPAGAALVGAHVHRAAAQERPQDEAGDTLLACRGTARGGRPSAVSRRSAVSRQRSAPGRSPCSSVPVRRVGLQAADHKAQHSYEFRSNRYTISRRLEQERYRSAGGSQSADGIWCLADW